jgi:hypothetical protein
MVLGSPKRRIWSRLAAYCSARSHRISFVTANSCRLALKFEVQLFKRETQPLDNVGSIAFPEPAALLTELHVAPRVLLVEMRCAILILRMVPATSVVLDFQPAAPRKGNGMSNFKTQEKSKT